MNNANSLHPPQQTSLYRRIIHCCFEPHHSIQTEEQRRRARILSAMLAVIIPLLFIPETLRARNTPGILSYFGPAIVLLIAAYIFSRTRYFAIGSGLAILTLSFLPLASVFMDTAIDPEHYSRKLFWVIPAFILGSLLLKPGQLILLYGINIIATASLPFFVNNLTQKHLNGPLGLTLATTVLLYVSARIYQSILQQIDEDIKARERTDQELRKLHRAAEQSASGIVITNEQGEVEYVNPAFTTITGYAKEEILGKNSNILRSSQHSDEFFRDLWDTIKNGVAWRGEIRNKKKNGELYWEIQTISPVHDDSGKTTHYVAIKDDISERKQMETDLAEARDQALTASRFKGKILAHASHDMRTPLGAIFGYATMMENGSFGPISDEQRKRLGNILSSTNQLRDFLDDLLQQSEIESGELSLNLQAFTPDQLLDDTRVIMTSLAERKDLNLIFSIDPQVPPTLWGDIYWLQRIISNLANNAVKFTKQGHVRIAITRPNEDQWAIQVSDTGPGIHTDAQKNIFKAFHKGDSRPDDMHMVGSGLGLAIVKAVSERMDGFVSLESKLGKGSTFFVTLPLLPIPENLFE